jgi:Lhr-like helicase
MDCLRLPTRGLECRLRGESRLIYSLTGGRKTLAAWLGPVQSALQEPLNNVALRVLWVTPLRALANNTRQHLEDTCTALGADVTVEIRIHRIALISATIHPMLS